MQYTAFLGITYCTTVCNLLLCLSCHFPTALAGRSCGASQWCKGSLATEKCSTCQSTVWNCRPCCTVPHPNFWSVLAKWLAPAAQSHEWHHLAWLQCNWQWSMWSIWTVYCSGQCNSSVHGFGRHLHAANGQQGAGKGAISAFVCLSVLQPWVANADGSIEGQTRWWGQSDVSAHHWQVIPGHTWGFGDNASAHWTVRSLSVLDPVSPWSHHQWWRGEDSTSQTQWCTSVGGHLVSQSVDASDATAYCLASGSRGPPHWAGGQSKPGNPAAPKPCRQGHGQQCKWGSDLAWMPLLW